MSNCKNCDKPIEVTQGRRPREFCDNNQKCRNEYYRKNKKAITHKIIPIDKWKEIEQKLNNITVKDLNIATNVVKPVELPKTNYTVNTIPKTYQELKDMCPNELTGLDRSIWIKENRVKYNL